MTMCDMTHGLLEFSLKETVGKRAHAPHATQVTPVVSLVRGFKKNRRRKATFLYFNTSGLSAAPTCFFQKSSKYCIT